MSEAVENDTLESNEPTSLVDAAEPTQRWLRNAGGSGARR